MTDDVGLLLNATIRVVVRRSPDDAGFTRHPTSAPALAPVDGRRFIPRAHSPRLVGAGFHARPALVDRQRYFAAPTLHQPLSHVASRRDSSPFRGAEGRAEVCGVYATVYRYADTYVSLPPVGCTVLGAPRSRDRRGRLAADVERDRLHSRHPRCAILASTTQRMQSRGHSPRTFCEACDNLVRCHTRRSVCLAPTVGGGVLDAPCAGLRTTSDTR